MLKIMVHVPWYLNIRCCLTVFRCTSIVINNRKKCKQNQRMTHLIQAMFQFMQNSFKFENLSHHLKIIFQSFYKQLILIIEVKSKIH